MFLNTTGCLFFWFFHCLLHISKNVPCLPQKFAKALLSISLGTVRGSLLPSGTLSYMFLTHESEAVGAGTMWLLTSFYIFIHFNLTVPEFFVGCLTLASGVFTTIIEAFLATYMLSGQLSGFFIRYPDFKSSNKVSRGTPGYGDPPRKEHLKDINKL